MKAADFIVAKTILTQPERGDGALSVFYEEHLDPSTLEDSEFAQKLTEMDEIDVHGWMLRVLLAEYHELGEQLFPGQRQLPYVRDSEAFAAWLYRLANRPPGTAGILQYKGKFLSVAVIFVAIKGKLEAEGLKPYRNRVRRSLYLERFAAVYLMGRDANMSAVEQLGDEWATALKVASIAKYKFKLRRDYKARHLNREQSMIVCLRRRLETVGTFAPEPEEAEASIADIPETEAEDVEESPPASADSAAVEPAQRADTSPDPAGRLLGHGEYEGPQRGIMAGSAPAERVPFPDVQVPSEA